MTRDQLIEKRRKKKRRKKLIAAGGAVCAAAVVFFAVRALTGRHGSVGPKPEVVEQQQDPEVVDTDTASRSAPPDGRTGEVGWNRDDGGWWFMNSDGSVYLNGWKTIEGQQYYFTDNGYMATGWVNTGTVKDTYFDETGMPDPSKQQKLIALTYDDGPSENTAKLLDALERHNAKATFFVVGKDQVEYYHDNMIRAAELGMEIGNHTWDHPWLNQLSADEIQEEISKNDDLIESYIGKRTTLLRPTGGGISRDLINAVNMPMIQWDVDTLDWDHLDADKTTERIKELVRDGSVVLMHDLFAPAADAAEDYLTWLESEGYKMVTISELAEAYGYSLDPGAQYYAFWPGGCDMNMTKEQGIERGTAAFD